MINIDLAHKKGLSLGTITRIETLQSLRSLLFEQMKTSENPEYLRSVDKYLDSLEEELQELWGFPKNKNYVKFWERPKCSCPKIDNGDNYPHGYYSISGDCLLHG